MSHTMQVPLVTPQALHDELQGEHPPILVDVREDFELEISVLPGVIHLPMDQIADRLDELDKDADYVIVCRSGARSGRVAAYMQSVGFTRVRNLVSGMNGWAATVDPDMRQY